MSHYITPAGAMGSLLADWSGEADIYVGPDTGWMPAAILRGHFVFALHEAIAAGRHLVRLDCARPEVQDRVVRWSEEGEQCPRCGGTTKVESIYGCPDCSESGWLRPPRPCRHLLAPALSPHHAVLLAQHARIVAAGGVGIVGVLLPWDDDGDERWGVQHLGPEDRRVSAFIGAPSWAIHHPTQGRLAHGPETGDAAKAAADAAALRLGFALLDADGIRLPLVPGETP